MTTLTYKPSAVEVEGVPATEDDLLDSSREARTNDVSGTPLGLINQAIKRGEVLKIEGHLPPQMEEHVVVDFPFGSVWRLRTGFERFVRLQEGFAEGYRYALIKSE